MPESRGVTVRGLDTAASIDPDGASRFLGDLQLDAFQGFDRLSGLSSNVSTPINGVYNPAVTTDMPGTSTASTQTVAIAPTHQYLCSAPKDDGVNGTPRVATESRMYNRSTQFVIWY